MLSRLLRALAWLAYGALLAGLFALTGYFAFNLFVRRGVTTVPQLVGLPAEEARALLVDQGLEAWTTEEARRFDDEAPKGHVADQDPGAGSLVKRGARVDLIVSLGPERIAVPELAGQTLYAAQITLAGSGLAVGRTASVFCRGGDPGTVAEQSPPPGEEVARDGSVHLFLCRADAGSTYVMPDLVYHRYAEARSFLTRRGFRFGRVKYEPYEGVRPGTVLRQFPLPGHPLRPADVISLVVATVEAATP